MFVIDVSVECNGALSIKLGFEIMEFKTINLLLIGESDYSIRFSRTSILRILE